MISSPNVQGYVHDANIEPSRLAEERHSDSESTPTVHLTWSTLWVIKKYQWHLDEVQNPFPLLVDTSDEASRIPFLVSFGIFLALRENSNY
jgi:hypothetical protein